MEHSEKYTYFKKKFERAETFDEGHAVWLELREYKGRLMGEEYRNFYPEYMELIRLHFSKPYDCLQ